MPDNLELTYKIADLDTEFDQIHRLNYQTFVREIPQHTPDPSEMLIDKFHDENTYVICLNGEKILGMLAMRGNRPFSLDQKLENLDSYLPNGHNICEFRLLTVERNRRFSSILKGLLRATLQHAMNQGYDLGIISGTTLQLKLYRHLGFEEFGPLVGSEDAKFQPMFITYRMLKDKDKMLLPSQTHQEERKQLVNLLPGPVAVNDSVAEAFTEIPISSRADNFVTDFHKLKRLLCELVNASNVEIFLGSGTLANDVVAGQLALLHGHGLMLSNGEFGDRLVNHATGFKLSFDKLSLKWGDELKSQAIIKQLDSNTKYDWLWVVHCETSSGVINNMNNLVEICGERKIKLCMDCTSSLGAVPIIVKDVYLSTGVSGKAMGSYPGISMVFYNHEIASAKMELPRYLDLGYYAEKNGIPFTLSSNLIYALYAAVKRFKTSDILAQTEKTAKWLRNSLENDGYTIVSASIETSPAVVTIELPKNVNSVDVGDYLEEAGFLVSYKSSYLVRKNGMQFCLMGDTPKEAILPMFKILKRLVTN